MATNIEFLDNLPVKFPFAEPDSCLCDTRPFRQLAQFSDPVLMVFKPKTTDVTVTNPNFTGNLTGWTAGTGWSYNSNKARLTAGAGNLEQNISHTVGQIYKITFTISNFSNTPPYGFYVSLGGTSTSAENPTGIQANGTYTVYLTPANSDNLKFGAGSVYVNLDLDTIVVEKIQQCYQLTAQEGEAAIPDIAKKMYVVNETAGTVSVINVTDMSVTKTITMPSAGLIYGSCFDYKNAKVWVGWQDGVFIIDAINDVVSNTINLGKAVTDLAYDNTIDAVYGLCSSTDEFVNFLADDEEVSQTTSTGDQPVAIAVNKTTGRTYVCNYLGNNVEVRAAGGGVSVNITITRPIAICYDEDTNQFFVSSATTDTVVVIDGSNDTIADTITSVTDPRGLDYDPSTQQVYVCSYSSDSVIVIDTATNNIYDTITGINEPVAITCDRINNKMYVAKNDTSAVAIIDTATNVVETSVGVGTKPAWITSTYFERTPATFTYYKDIAYAYATWSSLISTSIEGCYQLKLMDTCAETSYLSMEYNVKETHPCTIGLAFFGTYNSFGVPYEQFAWVTYPYPISLTLRNKYNFLRLQSYLVNSKYPAEVARYIDSGGSQKLYYGSNRKEKTMFIVECPEYMHDAIATAFIHDNLYTATSNGTERIQWLDSSYDPEWGGDNNYLYLAKSRAQIGKFTDDNKSVD